MNHSRPPQLRRLRPGEVPALNDLALVETAYGLLVPAHLAQQDSVAAPEPAESIFERFTLLTVTWKDLFGGRPTLDDVRARLRRYSLRQILGWVTRINLAVNIARRGNDARMSEQQVAIAQGLLGRDTAEALVDLTGEKHEEDLRRNRIMYFHERQMLNLLKQAFLVVDADAPDTDERPVGFVEAALMMNDLIDPPEGDMDPSTPEGRAAMDLYLTANTLFNQAPDDLHEFVRSSYLFVEDHPEIRERGVVNVPRLLERATGLEAEAVPHALFALYSHWATLTMDEVVAGRVAMRRSEYLETLPGLDAATRDKWFNLAAADLRTMQARLRDDATYGDNTFDVLRFEERPLIVVDDLVYCISVPLLRRLRGHSLQHRLLDPTVFNERETRRFLDTRGHLVEQYTTEILRRTYGDRFIHEDALKPLAGGVRVCDGIIVYPDALILVETKAASPRLDTRRGLNYEGYRATWHRHVKKAADQFESTIGLLRAGAFAELGLPRADGLELYPLIGVFEMPVHHMTYRAIREHDLGDHVFAQRMNRGEVKPFQLMHITEIESIERAVAAGRSLVDILRAKTAESAASDMSFHHFATITGERFLAGQSEWHAQRFEQQSEAAVQFFKRLGMSETAG